MKVEKEKNNKSFSLNKYKRYKSSSRYTYKPNNNNKKSFSKMNHFKPSESCPMSCKNKGSPKVRKYLNKNLGFNNHNTYDGKKIKKSNSALSINIFPK